MGKRSTNSLAVNTESALHHYVITCSWIVPRRLRKNQEPTSLLEPIDVLVDPAYYGFFISGPASTCFFGSAGAGLNLAGSGVPVSADLTSTI